MESHITFERTQSDQCEQWMKDGGSSKYMIARKCSEWLTCTYEDLVLNDFMVLSNTDRTDVTISR
jgi:hypothetical protein